MTIAQIAAQWKDAAGRDVTVGCYVAYAASIRRDTVLKFGLVTELLSKEVEQMIWDNVNRMYNREKVTVSKIRAIMSWRGNATGKRIYEHMGRLLVVDQGQIPKTDLDAIQKLWVGFEE